MTFGPSLPSPSYDSTTLLAIARQQRYMLTVMMVGIVFSTLHPLSAPIMALFWAQAMYKQCRLLKYPWPLIWARGGCIPLLGLVVLFSVNGAATKTLRQQGVAVGFLGASDDDIALRIPTHSPANTAP